MGSKIFQDHIFVFPITLQAEAVKILQATLFCWSSAAGEFMKLQWYIFE